MKLKHYSEQKLKKEILKIVGKYLDLERYEVFFFGSRVNDQESERSDIDVGIEGPQQVSLKTMAKIRDEISNLATLYSIDVVDFKSVSQDFLEVAKEKVESIT